MGSESGAGSAAETLRDMRGAPPRGPRTPWTPVLTISCSQQLLPGRALWPQKQPPRHLGFGPEAEIQLDKADGPYVPPSSGVSRGHSLSEKERTAPQPTWPLLAVSQRVVCPFSSEVGAAVPAQAGKRALEGGRGMGVRVSPSLSCPCLPEKSPWILGFSSARDHCSGPSRLLLHGGRSVQALSLLSARDPLSGL